MAMERWTSISSVDSNSSSWPGTLNTNNNNDSNNNNNSSKRRHNQQSASESFRSMVQALGSEKMTRIRGIIAEHHHQIQAGTPRKGSPPPGGMIFSPSSMGSSATTDTTDEVSLTIMHLESALGPEDMAELRASMISVRRQSIHLDVLISSDMTAEELERSVETVKTRQDEVLELIFVEIMDLIAAKLGIEVADSTALLPVVSREIEVVERRASWVLTKDVVSVQRDMLKVPEVDSTGKSPSISNGITGNGGLRQRHKPAQVNAKRPFGGYSLWPRSTEAGKGKGVDDAAGSSKERATMVTEKKKKRRGCVGICSIM